MASRILFWLILTPSLVFGFRVIPGINTWDIDKSTTTNSKLFLVYDNGSTSLENDFPGDDPLAGSSPVTIQQVMNSIMSDYNSVAGAFVTIVDSSDPDFATRGANRTITVRDGASIGLTSGGYAKPTLKDGKMVGCEIVLNPEFFKSAKNLTRGVTHELGHCLGLNHPMDTTHAVMSYYADGEPVRRLQIDDKMGLIYLYPVDPAAAKESATFGMACSRSE